MIIFTCCQSNRIKYYTNEELGGKNVLKNCLLASPKWSYFCCLELSPLRRLTWSLFIELSVQSRLQAQSFRGRVRDVQHDAGSVSRFSISWLLVSFSLNQNWWYCVTFPQDSWQIGRWHSGGLLTFYNNCAWCWLRSSVKAFDTSDQSSSVSAFCGSPEPMTLCWWVSSRSSPTSPCLSLSLTCCSQLISQTGMFLEGGFFVLLLLLLLTHHVMSHSSGPRGFQLARLPGPSPSSGICPSSCPIHRWHHPTISSSVTLFSSPLLPLQFPVQWFPLLAWS